MKKLFYTLGIALLMVGCSKDDFKDWATPQGYDPDPEETEKSVNATVTAGEAIDFATVTTDSVQLFTPSVTTKDTIASQSVSVELFNADSTKTAKIPASVKGVVATADIQKAVENIYGRKPVERVVNATVYFTSTLTNGFTVVTQSPLTIKAKPVAPEIEDAYYLTGSINGWDNSNKTYKLSNGGLDPYDYPTFKMRIPGDVVTENVEFKMTPESGIGGDWSKCLAAGASDGTFSYNNGGGNLSFAFVEGAKFYDLTFDMLDMTWSCKAVSFETYIWQAGNANGWGNPADALYGPNDDGKYTGFMYLDGDFKFRSGEDNWNAPDWGIGSSEGTLAELAGNLNTTAGYYKVDVDLSAMTYSLTPITTIGIIGPAQDGGWNDDTDMTYNTETKAWEATIELKADEIKFRANDGWDINWGGTTESLTQGGANIKIAEAGTYFIQLFAYCDTKAYCVITKK